MIMSGIEHLNGCPALAEALERWPELEPVYRALDDSMLACVFEKYLADVSPEQVSTFLREAGCLDLERVERHREALRLGELEQIGLAQVNRVPLVTIEDQATRLREDSAAGLESLKKGRWASVAFAGGAGTRFAAGLDGLQQALERPNEVLRAFGFDSREPKGAFPISPVGGLSFYEIILAQALSAGIESGRLPWVLFLTSQLTHERTLAFLKNRKPFGLPADSWIAFQQAQEPRLDMQGCLIADRGGHINQTGDGHGGVYRALLTTRLNDRPILELLGANGVDQLVMHNVDNPAARPYFLPRLGFHLREKALFTLSAVRKTDPNEKVGMLMMLRDSGSMEVIEYNVLDPRVAGARDMQTGRLLHEAGNANTNLIDTQAICDDFEPTLYTGKKIVSRIGQVSASSFEKLNQHITRTLDPARVRAYEIKRDELFFPTKNVTGTDSVESSTRMLSDMCMRLMRDCGANVEDGALIDLFPAYWSSKERLARLGIGPDWHIGCGARLYLCAGPGPISDGPVILEEESSLILYENKPYGHLTLDAERRLTADPAGMSHLHIGRGVTIGRGVRLVMHIGPGGRLRIPAGRSVTTDTQVKVGANEEKTL
jgi:hypothetical protein